MNSSPEWWVSVPEGEKAFFHALMGTIEGLTVNGSPGVSQAARVWQASLGGFIKTRLRHRRRRKGFPLKKISSPLPSPKRGEGDRLPSLGEDGEPERRAA